MTWQEFTALLVLASAMSFSPGPNTTLSTTLAANGGLPRAMRFVCAVPVGWSLLLLLTAAGLGALVTAAPAVRVAVKAAGIAYLLWMAWRLWGADRMAQASAAQLQVGFWQGVGLQFVNIKAWLLALAIVAGWVSGQAQPMVRTGIVTGVMILFALASNLAYAAAGALLRGWLAQGRRLLMFNRAMALLLVLTAVWMVKA
ncbi:LysE family translocator [Pseudacidovorax intermedius]|uniref:Threonine/homoserine/homoserine lactone efflux protein n=1 Tax=Pseudacidovorax intermedius TaxID=433924 RepID=A0A370FPB7_9BURK|nr:LysE family transporter [Pseudacidovorax intermedius]RDI29577.1 threonine/homoserine/homoserine lactone efflux protein [Pseudacidovorax intermedius]